MFSDDISNLCESKYKNDMNLLWGALVIQMNEFTDETFGCIEKILKKHKNDRAVVRSLANAKHQTKDRLHTLDSIYCSNMGNPSSSTYLGRTSLEDLYGKTQRKIAHTRRRDMVISYYNSPNTESFMDKSRWSNCSGPYTEDELQTLQQVFEPESPYIYRDRQNRKVSTFFYINLTDLMQ